MLEVARIGRHSPSYVVHGVRDPVVGCLASVAKSEALHRIASTRVPGGPRRSAGGAPYIMSPGDTKHLECKSRGAVSHGRSRTGRLREMGTVESQGHEGRGGGPTLPTCALRAEGTPQGVGSQLGVQQRDAPRRLPWRHPRACGMQYLSGDVPTRASGGLFSTRKRTPLATRAVFG